MTLPPAGLLHRVQTLCILGRVSNLPTVPSNCLAGWLLGGTGEPETFVWLTAGAMLVYTGGMFLNDAVDAEWDRRHRPERPIPSGQFAWRRVLLGGSVLLVVGWLLLLAAGQRCAFVGLLLVLAVVVYDLLHKRVPFAPVLMALCRGLLYLTAAAAAKKGVTQPALLGSLAIAAYVGGLSFFARRESTPDLSASRRQPIRVGSARGDLPRQRALRALVTPRQPALLLLAPPALALFTRGGLLPLPAVAAGAVFVLWTGWCLYRPFATARPNLGACVSGLLAGIPLVDALVSAGDSWSAAGIFLALFGLARLSQRLAPAT